MYPTRTTSTTGTLRVPPVAAPTALAVPTAPAAPTAPTGPAYETAEPAPAPVRGVAAPREAFEPSAPPVLVGAAVAAQPEPVAAAETSTGWAFVPAVRTVEQAVPPLPQAFDVPAARAQAEPEPAHTSLDIPDPQDEAAHAGVATLRLRIADAGAAAARPQGHGLERASQPQPAEPGPRAAGAAAALHPRMAGAEAAVGRPQGPDPQAVRVAVPEREPEPAESDAAQAAAALRTWVATAEAAAAPPQGPGPERVPEPGAARIAAAHPQGPDPQAEPQRAEPEAVRVAVPEPEPAEAARVTAALRMRTAEAGAAAAHRQAPDPQAEPQRAEPEVVGVAVPQPEPAESEAAQAAAALRMWVATAEAAAAPPQGPGPERAPEPGAARITAAPPQGPGRQRAPEPSHPQGTGSQPEREPAEAGGVGEAGREPQPVAPRSGTGVPGSGVPGPGVAEIVAQAVARGLEKPVEGGTQDTPRLGRRRGAAVTEVPVHLPFRGGPNRTPAPAPAEPAAGAAARARSVTPRPAPGRRAPRGDDRLREHRGPVLPGWIGVGVGGLALAGCAAVLWRAGVVPPVLLAAFGAAPRAYQGLRATHWPPLAFLGIVALLALGGLGRIRTGHAWVLTLCGSYRGTVRRTGLTWVSPLLLRRRVDVRLRHWRSDPMPAVDSGGLALQVVVQVVWQVKDTARATLAVEDHVEYLAQQVESAMARVLSQLPADAFHEDAPTLRDAEAVGDALTRMLAAETEAVGIEVFSAQPTRIEYAAEVAEAMRRRRVAAIDAKHRDTVLTSVVDAVDDTVHRLTSRGLVELDDYERKALVKDLTVAFYTGRSE
ncbi:SPFH domain-containing protein [Streptomyces sp. NPDC048269]|uniref:SPFH domain-containing protein n=1 Tax=Streptomyces sp. NPDC048269 TaxID=3155753 RepID=UPI00344119E5